MVNDAIISSYEIWAILEEGGPMKRIRTTIGLPKARAEADGLMKEHGFFGIGVKMAGRTSWSYVNSLKCGPDDPSAAKQKKLPKWARPALPMAGNPVADE